MKINKILSICAAMALLSSGCSDDMGLQPGNAPVEGTAQTVRISASMGDTGSRLAYSDMDTELALLWEQGDVLKVLNANDTLITDFALVDGENSSVAHFEGTPAQAYEEGDNLHVLYHNNLVQTDWDADGNLCLKLKDQTGRLNQDFQLMYGSTVYEGEGSDLSLKLKNLVSIIKLVIPTDKTLASVSLTENFRTQAKLVVKKSPSDAHNLTFYPGDVVYNEDVFNYDEEGNYIGGNGGITVTGPFEPKNGEVTVYFYVLSPKEYTTEQDWYGSHNYIAAFNAYDVDGQVYMNAKDFNYKGLEQGHLYEVRSPLFQIVDFENEAIAKGTVDEPYEIANVEQFYSFMWRCRWGAQDRYNNYYDARSYRLTSDIVLDNNIPYHSIDYNGQWFDGGGHTLYGKVYGGVFSYVGGSTISDLTLDMQVTNRERSGYGTAAGLIIYAWDATLLNCGTRSYVSVRADNLGGLVGECNNSKMYGCWSEGHIEIIEPGWLQTVGGLVAKMDYNSVVEACYNIGGISGEYQHAYAGSLVGRMDIDDEGNGAFLNACWSTVDWEQMVGRGNTTSCFMVKKAPTADQYAAMNAAMTNSYYEFDVTTGTFVPKKPATSLPGFDIEDF